MIKRVNFTGRRRIPRSRVDVTVHEGQPRRVSATFDLAGIQFLPEAEVVLEATSTGSPIVERIQCGTVQQLSPPTNRPLHEVEGENVYFTLKVIDRSKRTGQILGMADQIRPERAGSPTAGGRRGILPIEPHDLGQELWRLEFRDQDVILYVNEKVPDLKDRIRSDQFLCAAIYPEIVRRVLARAIDEDVDLDEENNERWPILWLHFARALHPAKQLPPGSDDPDEVQEEWIEDVVTAFCDAHLFKDKCLKALIGSEEEQ